MRNTGEADFAARADDQIGVGQAGGVKMAGDGFRGDFLYRLGQRCPLVRQAAEHCAYRVGDFLTPAISDGDVELQPVIGRSGALGRPDRREHRLGQQGKAADRANPDAPAMDLRVAGQRRQLGLDRRQDAGNFGRRPLEIVGGKDP